MLLYTFSEPKLEAPLSPKELAPPPPIRLCGAITPLIEPPLEPPPKGYGLLLVY